MKIIVFVIIMMIKMRSSRDETLVRNTLIWLGTIPNIQDVVASAHLKVCNMVM